MLIAARQLLGIFYKLLQFTYICCPLSAPYRDKLSSISCRQTVFLLRVQLKFLSSPLEGDVIQRTVCLKWQGKKVYCKKSPTQPTILRFSFVSDAIHSVWSCVCTWAHSCASVIVSCWSSWVCRSCGRLLLSVWEHCDPLLQSCGSAWAQTLGDPVGRWTNSGALLHWFRPPQILPTAGALWRSDDGHSAEFPTRSSSGKLATRRCAGQHTGSEPKGEETRDWMWFCRTSQ